MSDADFSTMTITWTLCRYRRLRLIGSDQWAESIPIARLKVGRFHTVENRRLQVNSSVSRYQHHLGRSTWKVSSDPGDLQRS